MHLVFDRLILVTNKGCMDIILTKTYYFTKGLIWVFPKYKNKKHTVCVVLSPPDFDKIRLKKYTPFPIFF